jgi:two-component system chemotaxis sensor kinase CheA
MDKSLSFEIEADELEVFLEDVNEHLQAMEAGILSLEQGNDPDVLGAVFRAAHTLKAVAGAVGHRQMAELTHTMETLFDALRQDRLSPTPGMTDELLSAVDVLKTLRDEVVRLEPGGADVPALLARLRDLAEDAVTESDQVRQENRDSKERMLRQLTPEQESLVHDCRREGLTLWDVQVTASADAFAPAARLLQAAMAMAEVGRIVVQEPPQADLAGGEQTDSLWLVLATRADCETIEALLRDVSDLAAFRVHPYQVSAPQKPERDVTDASDTSEGAGTFDATPRAVRISVERLDTLMNLVGELVTERTRLAQIGDTLRTEFGKGGTVGELGEMVVHLNRVVDQLQHEVMQARMLPIERLFNKLPRLVRDVARAAGRQVNLVIEGEDTELDRSVIEAIGDPLVHLLRNAVDHGIEPADERVAAGKPPLGTVRLTAAHEEGHIIVTVEDDGRGIDPQQVRQVAVRRGLLSEEEASQLDDDEAVALIFLPNFSTADKVTGVSGRGVGMDVVQTNVKRIGGSVAVESEAGRGTTFRITLPLTLAIVQAMMVALGDDVYAVPLAGVIESLYLEDVTVSKVKGHPTIRWRDQALPLIRLREFYADPRLADAPPDDAKPVADTPLWEGAAVVVSWGKLRAGLIVDKLVGKQDIVAKSLGPIVGNVPGVSGCTIMGNGRIALIVDVPGLIGAAISRQRAAQTLGQGAGV